MATEHVLNEAKKIKKSSKKKHPIYDFAGILTDKEANEMKKIIAE